MSEAPRVCARPVLPDGSQGDADTYVLASDYDALRAECDRWEEIMTDELAESRRLMDLGGAREDESFTAFAERVIAERDAVRAEVELLQAVRATAKLQNDTNAELRAEVERLRALFLPLSLAPELHESVHGPRYRCRQCGYAWMQEGKPQKHSADCAYVVARAALQDPAEDQPQCCGRPEIGGEYMGAQEQVCCGQPEPKT